MIGSISGVLIGVIAQKKDNSVSPEFATMIVGSIGGLTGGLVGGIIGGYKLKIDLNGNENLNQKQLKKLAKHNLSPY